MSRCKHALWATSCGDTSCDLHGAYETKWAGRGPSVEREEDFKRALAAGGPSPLDLAARLKVLREGVPRWHEVDQGGEIFGWKMPDERGCYRVVAAPREVEAFTAAVLAQAVE